MPNNKITWSTLEYEHRERSTDWFWALGVISLSIAVTSAIFKNYMFAILIVIAALMLIMFALKIPEEFQIEIDEKGIKIKDEFYPYKKLKSFWIDRSDKKQTKLIINATRIIMPHIVLPVPQYLENETREFLLAHLKEEEMHESLGHKIMEFLGL